MNNPNPSDTEKQAAEEAAKQKQAAEAAAAAAQKEAEAAAAKAAKAAKVEAPAWQLPDYAGPLDIRQAQWRLRNIKPVGEVKRK